MKRNFVAFGLVLVAVAITGACGSTTPGGASDDAGGGGAADGSTSTFGDGAILGDGAPGSGPVLLPDGALASCVPLVMADGTTRQCSDCVDNDGDGKPDWLDPECAGPLDNDEATFGTGIPGDNVDACKQDCFFDGNSGAGDDRCEWNLKCDPKNTSGQCPYDADFKNCPATQAAQCKTFCEPLVPNGCDCFGCCAVQKADGTSVTVRLSSTCSSATLDDATKCNPCTQAADCANPCDRCELCVGKTSIPADCATAPGADSGAADGGGGGTGGQICSNGAQVCNANLACPSGTYCLTGCCTPIVIR